MTLVRPPLTPEAALRPGLDAAHPAPRAFAAWPQARAGLLATLRAERLAADGCLLIAETGEEHDWAEAARLAGSLTGARYFAPR